MLLRLLTLPISAPIAGIRYCLEKVAEVAEREMWDEEPVREQLILVNQAFEEGRMPETEFREREAELLARLREIREHARARARMEMDDAGAAVDRRRSVVIDVPDEIK
ncbi:MAG TPA: gas vesicle protein GvpG [Candidatus Acidoferrales bacterium]|nr:gas vesicle protein GvpG [Candidatus Acidoferrales bacterium]